MSPDRQGCERRAGRGGCHPCRNVARPSRTAAPFAGHGGGAAHRDHPAMRNIVCRRGEATCIARMLASSACREHAHAALSIGRRAAMRQWRHPPPSALREGCAAALRGHPLQG